MFKVKRALLTGGEGECFMNSANKKQVCGLIKKSSNPLILIPENFDIDSVSGALALHLFLEKSKKNPSIACSVAIPEKFLFLADKKIIENDIQGECRYKISFDIGDSQIRELSYEQEEGILKINLATVGNKFVLEKPRVDQLKFKYDLIFSIGSPDLGSLGKIYYDNSCFFSEMPIVNIDCRAKNEKYGSVNLIQPDSSVSELIAEIVGMISRDILDSRIADLLLAGIIAKTNNFQAAKIKAETFALVSVLLRTGANREEVVRYLSNISLLATEKTEFYPSSKITKQIIDKINRESPWYLRQERRNAKRLDGLMLLSLNQRIFYLAAILGVIPGLMLLERANPASAPALKNSESVLLEESLTGVEEKKSLTNESIFFQKNANVFPFVNGIGEGSTQNEKTADSAGSRNKVIATSLTIVGGDNFSESKDGTGKNIALDDKTAVIGIPKNFSMPLLEINAEIQEVGLTSGGEMETPANFKSVGWFRFGAKPGENGNAVLAGHLDTYLDKGGIFWNLNKMKPGDFVYVTDEYGKKLRFKVTRSEIYDAESAPMEEIFGPSDKPYLNLITCDGAWDSGKKSYNKRLVVFTDYDPE